MEEWLQMIKEVGFPVLVTLYLLHRIERKMEKLNDTMHQLPERLKPLVDMKRMN